MRGIDSSIKGGGVIGWLAAGDTPKPLLSRWYPFYYMDSLRVFASYLYSLCECFLFIFVFFALFLFSCSRVLQSLAIHVRRDKKKQGVDGEK